MCKCEEQSGERGMEEAGEAESRLDKGYGKGGEPGEQGIEEPGRQGTLDKEKRGN